MPKVAYLGFHLAVCSLEKEEEDQFLIVCEPASDGSPAASITIMGKEAIFALHELIEQTLQDFEDRQEIAKMSQDLRQTD